MEMTDLLAAINKTPQDPTLWNQMGVLSVEQNDLETAQTCFETLVALAPKSAISWDNLARVYLAASDEVKAIKAFKQAILIDPQYKQARLALAQMLIAEGLEEALTIITDGIKLHPECQELKLHLVKVHMQQQNFDLAVREAAAVVDHAESSYDQITEAATCFYDARRLDLAVTAYAKAIERDSTRPQGFHGFGVCHQMMGSIQVAKEAYERALMLNPDSPGALSNLSVISANLGDYPLAIEQMSKSIVLAPDDPGSIIQLQYFKRHVCDWSNSLAPGDIERYCDEARAAVSPFQVLPLTDNPSLQLRLAKRWGQRSRVGTPKNLTLCERTGEKIRVGWFGNDFHDHATLFLMSGLFREYDRSRFEFFVYSYGMIKSSPMRSECEANVDKFVDVAGHTDSEIVALARSDELDIAIDLKAFTNGGRVSLFQERLAPVQINFLGYPGTSGSDAYDYVIGDDVVIPDDLEWAYSETVLKMPHTYQPNDEMRQISDADFTREEEGIPEGAFVFCSFNNTYKIGPAEFDVWMRLLREVDRSVLWLLEANSAVAENLRREAAARGVDPSRLIFARRKPVSEHLARHTLADLFLDTFNVNAHTTASDALWAGLPVVTLPGQQFAARVGASLVCAAGLPQLVASDRDDYFSIAKRFACDAKLLSAVRQQLRDKRSKLPLFDTRSYCRGFEQLLCAAARQ